MIGAHITGGDIFIVEENEDSPDGVVVAALFTGDSVRIHFDRLGYELRAVAGADAKFHLGGAVRPV